MHTALLLLLPLLIAPGDWRLKVGDAPRVHKRNESEEEALPMQPENEGPCRQSRGAGLTVLLA